MCGGTTAWACADVAAGWTVPLPVPVAWLGQEYPPYAGCVSLRRRPAVSAALRLHARRDGGGVTCARCRAVRRQPPWQFRSLLSSRATETRPPKEIPNLLRFPRTTPFSSPTPPAQSAPSATLPPSVPHPPTSFHPRQAPRWRRRCGTANTEASLPRAVLLHHPTPPPTSPPPKHATQEDQDAIRAGLPPFPPSFHSRGVSAHPPVQTLPTFPALFKGGCG